MYIGITKLFMGWRHELIKLADLIICSDSAHNSHVCVWDVADKLDSLYATNDRGWFGWLGVLV